MNNKNNKIIKRKEEIENLSIPRFEKDKMIKDEKLWTVYANSLSDKRKLLIEAQFLPEKFEAALYFLQSEGSFGGGHLNNTSPAIAGEESYLESMIICVNAIMRWFLNDIEMPLEEIEKIICTEKTQIKKNINKLKSQLQK